MSTTKYWLKDNPSVTAEVIDGFEPDDAGGVPALLTNNDHHGEPSRLYALLRLEDWSSTEIFSAPEETLKKAYLSLFQGKEDIFYVFMATEENAKVSMAATTAIGYVPVTIHTDAMVPAPDDLLVLG
jgi:hypothetical protein